MGSSVRPYFFYKLRTALSNIGHVYGKDRKSSKNVVSVLGQNKNFMAAEPNSSHDL